MIRQLSRLTAKTRRLGREPSSVWSPRDSVRPTFCGTLLQRSFSDQQKKANDGEHWSEKKVAGYVGHNFPDFIEHWNREAFRRVGYGLGASTVAVVSAAAVYPGMMVPAALTGALTAAYWHIGLRDMKQTAHAIRRNYPVLGNARYIVETIRPEIRQYLIESDTEGKPFFRLQRALIYQRSKNVDDTLPFGTRRNVYDVNHEWACHSMWPTEITDPEAKRCRIGTSEYGTTKPYSASVLNVSAMSYGAISDNAILALSAGAKAGNFYHNTGEGGVSKSHLKGGGDIVWNVGTGYFGCGSTNAQGSRVFEPAILKQTVEESEGRIKMIEIKLSQGAKPGHGGILPMAKITPEIADARKLPYPPTGDCHSPAQHSAFSNPWELVEFISTVRQASGGLPVGIKMCVGEPGDVAALAKAMLDLGNGPDFITVDGGEGGTGAAPPEFSNSVGLPLEEGLVVVRNMLVGAGLRDKTRLVGSGKVASGFSLVKTLALGADITCAARAFMLSLGCIQALKCNTNKCPTGIATQDKNLQYGLDPSEKQVRVHSFHTQTVHAASEIVGAIGYEGFSKVSGNDIMRRVKHGQVQTLSEHFPVVESGCLLTGKGPQRLQEIWDMSGTEHVSSRRWIY